MNGTQIMNKVITDNTPELNSIKAQMASILDKMATTIPTLKAKGMSTSEIKAQADQMIRSQLRRIQNGKTDYMVERNGKPAILGIGQVTANAIVENFNYYHTK